MLAATLVSSAGSATLPLAALVGGTTARISIREIHIYNKTAIAADLLLCRVTTAGTPGAAATTRLLDEVDGVTFGTLRNTYTSTAPTTTDLGIGVELGAAIGSGVLLPFGPKELIIPAVANAAVGIVAGDTAGQSCRITFKWELA